MYDLKRIAVNTKIKVNKKLLDILKKPTIRYSQQSNIFKWKKYIKLI